jgi:prefoldin subunit 5
MANPSLEELEERIAILRDNIRELTEQAAALSGAEDETRAADRIADQEEQLAELLKERESLINRVRSSRP